MRRRDFLTTVAAASLSAAGHRTGGRGAAAPRRRAPEQLKLGVASYSLRKFPFDKALEMAKACDVSYINFKDVHLPRTDPPEAIKAARAKTEAAGFTIMGGGTITWQKKGERGRRATTSRCARTSSTPSSPACRSSSPRRASRRSTRSRRWPRSSTSRSPSTITARRTSSSRRRTTSTSTSRAATSTWGCASTSATRGGPESIRPRPSSSCATASTTSTSRILRDLKKRDSQVIVGKGAIDFPGLFRALVKIGYTGHVGLEYRDRCRRAAAGHAAVVRLHAGRPGRNPADLSTTESPENNRMIRHADIR